MSIGFPLPQVDCPHVLKESLCKVVMQEVEEAFGHRIVTSRDCIQLSDDICSKTSIRINSNTLRRFFGLVKAQYPPSFSTLTILANYCGYHSLDELSTVNKQRPNGQEAYHEKDILLYLLRLFKVMPVRCPVDETGFSFVKYTLQLFSQSPGLAVKLQKAIAKSSEGQASYFEQFIYIDQLSSFYGEGLRYYLREKKSVEGQVFGYSLLCLRDWLTLDHARLKRHFSFMQDVDTPKPADPYIYGLQVTARLLHAHVFTQDIPLIVQEAYKVYLGIKHVRSQPYLFKSLEYNLAIVLVLTQQFEDALYYINEALLRYPTPTNPIDQKCLTRLQLFKAIALTQGGILDEAALLFEQIHPSQFGFLTKKTDTILYITLASCLKKGNERWDKQLNELERETGFLKLRKVVQGKSWTSAVDTVCEQN